MKEKSPLELKIDTAVLKKIYNRPLSLKSLVAYLLPSSFNSSSETAKNNKNKLLLGQDPCADDSNKQSYFRKYTMRNLQPIEHAFPNPYAAKKDKTGQIKEELHSQRESHFHSEENWQTIYEKKFQTAANHEAVLSIVEEAVKSLGFDYVFYNLKTALPLSNPKNIIHTTYPSKWADQYIENNYALTDPCVQRALSSLQPFVWDQKLLSENPKLWSESSAFGINYGCTQSSCDINGVRGVLSLSRKELPLSEEEFQAKAMKINWLTHTAHIEFSKFASQLQSNSSAKLSKREVTVLRWTADGKTSNEIAQILGISERTVNFHIANAISRLNVTNKTAATIRATLLGLL